MTTKTNQVPDSELDEDLVAQYMKQNPDFFVNRDQLLIDMRIPHQPGGAVSLVERQVTLLRERQMATKKKLDNYVAAARVNDTIFKKSQKLILALIEATDSQAFFTSLEQSFRRDFKSSAYNLLVFDDQASQSNSSVSFISEDAARENIGSIMKRKKPTLGVLRTAETEFLFGQQSQLVQSAMVLSISRDQKPIAILAIGSSDKQYFSDAMGIMFISFIAETLSLLLPAHLSSK